MEGKSYEDVGIAILGAVVWDWASAGFSRSVGALQIRIHDRAVPPLVSEN